MRGYPKYKVGQQVKFECRTSAGIEIKHGSVFIVDEFGTFEDNSDVSYDILVEAEDCLYKHINEKYVQNEK